MAEATDAAVAVASDMLHQLVESVPYTGEGDDPVARDLGLDQPVEAPAGASGQEAAVAQEVEQETASVPSYEPEVPQDILDELEEPDFEAEAENELKLTETFTDEDVNFSDEDSDERKARLAAEKKVAWLEGRIVDQNKAKWEAEAIKYFPLSEHALKGIKVDSRRAFLREARIAHEAVLPYVKPLVDQLTAERERAKAEGALEGRQEAANAWGTPTTGPGSVPVLAAASNAELEAARKTGNLAKVISVMRKQATGAKE
jgi:hypothetical protein